MGFMTLADFRKELNHSLGPSSQADNSVLDLWINRAYFEASNMGAQEFFKADSTFNTVKDQIEYDLPTNLMVIMSIADLTSKHRLIGTSLDDYHSRDRTETGRPRYYARSGGTLVLWPTPDKVYEIELIYVLQPPTLTAEAHTTLIPNYFDHAIMLLATRNALLTLGEDERATLRHQSAIAYLREQQSEIEHGMGSLKEGFGFAQSHDDLTRMRGS